MDECAIDARSRLSSRLRSLWIAGLSLLAIGAIVVGTLALGDFGIPFGRVLQVLVQDDGSDAAFVIHEIRLPRLLTATLVGAALGLAGAIVQAITRNPLGEPGLLGVTAGAAFAMALCMTYLSLPTSAELAASTVGGIAAATLTLAIGMGARLDPLYLTLTGMSINLFFAAAIIVMLVSANVEVNGIYYWLTGSLINRTWEHVAMLWPWVVSGLVLGLACAGRLDTMILDEDVLTALGMRVTAWRLLFGLVVVLLSASAVAAAGPITFIGLVAPHIVRFGLGSRGIPTGPCYRSRHWWAPAWCALLILPPNGRRCRPASYAYFWVAQCWSIWSAGGRPPMRSPTHQVAMRSGGRYAAVLALLCTALALLVLASLFWGAVPLAAGDVLDGLLSRHAPSLESALVWQLRLPRTVLAVLVGLQLATAGLILQTVIRNPLADPGVVGISSGAGLAVVALLLVTDLAKADSLIGTNHASMMVWLPVVALFGGLVAAGLVLSMSWRSKLCPLRLTLNGVAVGAVLNALVMWTIVVWGGARTEIALIWLAGSLYGRDFLHVHVLWPWCLVGIVATLALLRPLSLLRLDDGVSASLGIRGIRWRTAAIVVAVVLAASAVAVTGPVGFVGLVTPHLSRLIAGPNERRLFVVNMLVGSLLMLGADCLARSLISPLEIPAGALTTLIGIPAFLLLLHRQRRHRV